MSEGEPGLKKTLSGLHLWGIAVGLVISGEYFGWSYGWALAGTLGFLVTTAFIAVMYTTFIFSFTELTTAIPHAGGPFAYSYRAFGPLGGYVAGFSTLVEFVFAPPAIALAIGAYLNAGQRSAVHESVRCTEHLAGVLTALEVQSARALRLAGRRLQAVCKFRCQLYRLYAQRAGELPGRQPSRHSTIPTTTYLKYHEASIHNL